MRLMTIPVGSLQANCYLLCADNGDAAVIDPGSEPERLMDHIRAEGLRVREIWLTHGHFDHVGAVPALCTKTGGRVIACAAEQALLADAQLNLSAVWPPMLTVRADTLYRDGDEFSFAGETVEVLHTPGHTAGSCCYRVGDYLFTGDTLFADSIGRTDFPTGDMAEMAASLRRLRMLEGDCAVLPGHGAATTLSAERQTNPYMK